MFLKMNHFNLFDSVVLTQAIPLTDGGVAEVGTVGAVVEALGDGEAYLVELFGNWVKYDEEGNFQPATETEAGSFMETLGVETVLPQQIALAPEKTTNIREQLHTVLAELSDELVAEVRDFAEFLLQKQG